MYREGPQGTPFHSLLVEGYVDASVDVCKLHQNTEIELLCTICIKRLIKTVKYN